MYQNINEMLKERQKSYCQKECPVKAWNDCADDLGKDYLMAAHCTECLVKHFVETITL
jgi:hypothetical protein